MRLSTPRVAIIAAVAVAGVLAFSGCSSSSSASSDSAGTSASGKKLSGDVVWADYGGSSNKSRQSIFFDGFTKKTGVTVTSTVVDNAKESSQLDGKAGDYDVMQTDAAQVVKDAANLHKVPTAAQGDLLPDNVKPYYINGFVFGEGMGWLTDTYKDGGPKDWADFFNTKKYPGKRAIPGSPALFDYMLEAALLADGVAPDKLYPLDLDRAVKKLDTIKSDLVFYQNYPEAQQLLSNGSAAIAVTVTSQFKGLQDAGTDVTVQWDQLFASPSGLVAPSTSKNLDAIDELSSYMADPKREAKFSEETGYGPVNKAAFDYISKSDQDGIVNAPSHKALITPDNDWRADNYDAMLKAYTTFLQG